ncbi:CoA-disulfide reductase [Thorsellia anophelis]|uniref:NADPH-dependent 2,4-dienoyl-CoA reductase, sulfur reductase n=1 Tax=Thorsellia anophelis DSM 18579 TaxID=1123402 RepID=A0A1I0AVR0_9GAMM|nr:CoA-disulfide reductase [Thorsellia anophelis]SES98069.1 NADPH-dependent 2,4-dienoyl-CoA reductase, sulfur reductase [Thorsellia anophelis DSM 18579]
MKKYLIVGANAAGLSAAVRIRKQHKDASITVLEKSEVISFGACGIPYYIGGEFDDLDRMSAREYSDFVKLGIEIKLNHTVIAVDTDQKRVKAIDAAGSESDFEFEMLLLASGASPIKPTIEGIDLPNCFTMHSQADAINIKKALNTTDKVAIIGGGFIGIEAAEAFKLQGKFVTLIEYSPNLLARTFDPEITDLLTQELKNSGVEVLTEHKVLKIAKSGPYLKVITDKVAIEVDTVILAVGFKPNTDFLSNTDITLNEQGAILINEYCQTTAPNIYAAGDCAIVPHRISKNSYIPLATTANKLGRLAGENMSGNQKAFIGTLGASGIRVFSLEAGRVGITEKDAKNANLDYATVFIKDKNRTDYVLPQTDIVIKLIYHKITKKLLGGQICGSYEGGAIGRVNALSVAIYSGITVEELGSMDFVYAPPFARTWDALNIAGNVAK